MEQAAVGHSGHLLGTVVHYSEGNSRVNVVSVMGPVQVNTELHSTVNQ